MQRENPETFARFFGHYEPRVLRYLVCIVGDAEIAKSAAAETWARYAHYVERPSPRLDAALLIAVARNAARDARCAVGTPPTTAPQAPAGGDAPRMARLVCSLPDGERDLVALRCELDLPPQDVCRALGISEEIAADSLRQAHARLHAAFGGEDGRYERALRSIGLACDRMVEGVCPATLQGRPGTRRSHRQTAWQAARLWALRAAIVFGLVWLSHLALSVGQRAGI
jgi:DNA-directed RNA polymerase specialized sigma24 family protein